MIERAIALEGSTLVASCTEAFSEHAAWLLNLLRGEMTEPGGPTLRDGLRIQVGWTKFTMVQHGDRYSVCEPDFSTDPHEHLREDISVSLGVMLEQNLWSKTLNAPLNPAYYAEIVILQKCCLESERIYLERRRPNGHDSGWYVGMTEGGRPAEADLEAREIWTVLRDRPALIQFFALPAGFLVIMERDQAISIANENNETVYSA